jgi:rSAM/selenodomain-associated transferase 2
MRPPAVTVVIPALDESPRIGAAVASARAAFGEAAEILVVDGGSADGTAARAAAAGARVLITARGRGPQLAAGAAAAGAPVLVFLHADTLLPADAAPAIARALADSAVSGGAFRLAFHTADGPVPLRLRLLAAAINLRSRLFRTATGDQAIFARADRLAAAGGVPEEPLFEDVRLYRRLRAVGAVRLLDATVRTSPRLWLRAGTGRIVLTHLALRALHAAGVSPSRLVRWYPTTGAP